MIKLIKPIIDKRNPNKIHKNRTLSYSKSTKHELSSNSVLLINKYYSKLNYGNLDLCKNLIDKNKINFVNKNNTMLIPLIRDKDKIKINVNKGSDNILNNIPVKIIKQKIKKNSNLFQQNDINDYIKQKLLNINNYKA